MSCLQKISKTVFFQALLDKHTFPQRFPIFQQKRYKRYKQKWASNLKKKTHCEQALQHFDIFYGKVFGKLWPSIRISLLSQPKYCALLNNYNNNLSKENEHFLQNLGALNFVKLSKEITCEVTEIQSQEVIRTKHKEDISVYEEDKLKPEEANDNFVLRDGRVLFPDSYTPIDGKNTNLYDFVPTENVYTQKELLKQEIVKQNVFEDHNIPINFITEDIPEIPDTLKAFCFERGNVSLFPPPKVKTGTKKLGYFMMDAASVLPVIALDIQECDNVLDICAAPGGKMLTMLQYPYAGSILCNDVSRSRLQRLSRILDSYGNQSMVDMVTVQQSDGTNFTQSEYDKVLVDVPCTNDRHSVMEEDNNIFKPGRIKERLNLPTVQKNLLVSGIMSCVPGGYVVYSTCSLSPAQNDGVIQAALEHIWKETNIDIEIVDLKYLKTIFKHTFIFFEDCKFGQLIIPSVTANFGPMYICKLKRVK